MFTKGEKVILKSESNCINPTVYTILSCNIINYDVQAENGSVMCCGENTIMRYSEYIESMPNIQLNTIPTYSEALYLRLLGRGLRVPNEKSNTSFYESLASGFEEPIIHTTECKLTDAQISLLEEMKQYQFTNIPIGFCKSNPNE